MDWNSGTPGSDKAIKLGCTCPVWDNSNGEGLFWINEHCPVHKDTRGQDVVQVGLEED